MFSFCNRGNLHNLFDNSLLILKVKELRGIRSPTGYPEETVPSFSLVAPTATYILPGIIPWLENRALKMARSSHFFFLLDKAASIQWLLDRSSCRMHLPSHSYSTTSVHESNKGPHPVLIVPERRNKNITNDFSLPSSQSPCSVTFPGRYEQTNPWQLKRLFQSGLA